ncbi:MAG: cheW1 [Paenibacillaceae bacterium]|nr:cheW1 [Paenibacillaceae bacterium]
MSVATDSYEKPAPAQLVTFWLEGRKYAFPVSAVSSVVQAQQVTRIPGSECYVEGLINLRGAILTVVNGRAWVAGRSGEQPPTSRVLVVRHEQKLAGFMVDELDEVAAVEDSQYSSSGPVEQNRVLGYVKMGDSIIRLLNIRLIFDKLQELSSKEFAGSGSGNRWIGSGSAATQSSRLAADLGEEEHRENDQILKFIVGEEWYGLPIGQVREILPYPDQLEPLAGMSEGVLGFGMYPGGRMLPILLGAWLIQGRVSSALPDRVIVLEPILAGQTCLVGIAVDSVRDVAECPASVLHIPESMNLRSDYIQCVVPAGRASEPLFLLNLAQLLEHPGLASVIRANTLTGQFGAEGEAADNRNRLYLFFQLNGQQLGMPADTVREVVRLAAFTPIPNAERSIAGIANIRGQLVTVLDTAAALEEEAASGPEYRHLIVTEARGKLIGLAVDRIDRVLGASPGQVQEMGGKFPGWDQAWFGGVYCRGEGEEITPLIAPEKLLP